MVQDDPSLRGYNVPELVDLFVEYVNNQVIQSYDKQCSPYFQWMQMPQLLMWVVFSQQSKEFRTNHIMWPMGDDFAYENANTWYKQIDKLIHYVNMVLFYPE